MSFGTGVIHAKSSKQKINTKSLTEAELVGVSGYLLYYIWVDNFLQHQGYKLKRKVLYQDNHRVQLRWKSMDKILVPVTPVT